MLNGEKYQERIKELDYRVAIDINSNELKHCNEMNCCNCKFKGNDCGRKRVEWLLKEYEEPILAEEDKRILKDIINVYNSFNKKIVDIRKYHICRGCSLHINYIDRGEDTSCIETHTTLPFNGDKLFKGMELGKTYTLEELGL